MAGCKCMMKERSIWKWVRSIVAIIVMTFWVHVLIAISLVFGCGDIALPQSAWYRREGHSAVVGCEGRDKTWTLTCRDDMWHGTVGNCTENGNMHVLTWIQAQIFGLNSSTKMWETGFTNNRIYQFKNSLAMNVWRLLQQCKPGTDIIILLNMYSNSTTPIVIILNMRYD